jgi:hypothetical protein
MDMWPFHDWLVPAPTPPTGVIPVDPAKRGRGNADPLTAWPRPIAGSGAVELSPGMVIPQTPLGGVGPGGPGLPLLVPSVLSTAGMNPAEGTTPTSVTPGTQLRGEVSKGIEQARVRCH